MGQSRRTFFSKLATSAALVATAPWNAAANAKSLGRGLIKLNDLSPAEAVINETTWEQIRLAYTVSPSIINLNNGGVSPQPKVVQDAVDRYYHYSNEMPSYSMWRTLDQGREPVREKLAHLAGCSSEEIAVNRNSTEALDTVIFGLDLNAGDEVVLTKQDYPNMINAWKQREIRDKIKLVWLNLEMPSEDPEYLLKQFTNAFTSKTKVVHVTQMINWNGQILPAAEICKAARSRGIKSIVDGAHTFAHFQFKITDLNCDYFGSSLHKWLCAPFGTGMLWVAKDNIKELWPLFPHHEPQSDNIRKFENLGTRSFAPEQAIGQAIDFHHAIGSERKEARLRYLKNYWCEKVADIPKVKINTSLKDEFSCALANFSIEGMEPGQISSALYRDYKIHTTAIKWENINGVRVTPHVYTLKYDLDKLVRAIGEIAAKA